MDIISSSISKTADFCRNFPSPPTVALSRQTVIEHMMKLLNGAMSRMLFIEGETLAGKSTLLADYMNVNPQDTIGVFLSAGDNYFYTTEYVKVAIYEQMYWIVNSVQAPEDLITDANFSRLLLQLQRKARNKPITFLIDGLSSNVSSNDRLNREILELFPLSQTEFKFVISGSSDLFSTIELEKYKPKNIPILPIGRDEAKIYFSECTEVYGEDIERIRHFCRGTIGELARFKELILSGVAVSDLLNEKEGNLRKLLEFEWNIIKNDNDTVNLLGYLAFSTQPLNKEKLSRLTNNGLENVVEICSKCHFIEIDSSSEIVIIRSEEERRFVRDKMNNAKTKYLEHFIAELLKDPDSEESTRYLPYQLMDVGRHGDLIHRLDEEHFVRLLGTEKSLRSLKKHCAVGINAAKLLKDETAEVRFALINSVITGLTFSVGTKSEIEARLRLGERETALALALSAPTSEERLELLAALAKAFHASNLVVPHEVKEQIKYLISGLDFTSFANLAHDIACDLLVVDFSLAIEVFEKSMSEATAQKKIKAEDDSSDTYSAQQKSSDLESGFDRVHSRLSEYHQQRFDDAIATLVERSTPDALRSRFKDAEDKHQILVAKQWLKRNRKHPEAIKLAEHALDLTLADLSRPPRIQDFREIAVILPHLKDSSDVDRLAKRIKAQLETQLSFGTNVELVRLKMILIRAAYSSTPSECDVELIDLFSEIYQIKETSTRAACWSWMLYGLQKLADPEAVDGRTSVISEITEKLIESIEDLLESSADHYETAKNAIYALARANPSLAVQLVEKLNTSYRRDKAFGVLARELITSRIYLKNPGLLLSCISKIESQAEREKTVLRCLSSIAKDADRGESVSSNGGILTLWRSLKVAIKKFSAGGATYRIMAATGAGTEKLEQMAAELAALWPDVMVDWVRTDSGYSFARDIAKVNRELAIEWLEKVTAERRHSKIPSKGLVNVLYLTVRLAMESFSNIVSNDCERTDPQFSRMAFLIESIPVPEFRITLWCDFGISLHYKSKRQISRMICTDYVHGILQESFDNNEAVRDKLTEIAAPFLYLTHPPLANVLFARMHDFVQQESAREDICRTILRRRSTNEPYKGHDSPGYDIDSEDISSILDILKEMRTDTYIFSILSDLCESLSSKKNVNKIRRSQARDFLNSIEDLIEKKLPDSRNIKHCGYKLAAKAHVLKARATFESIAPSIWENLYTQALAITNVADRVIVVTMIAVSAKNKVAFGDRKWIDVVKEDIKKIPSDVDRIDRYSWVAELIEPVDKHQSINLLHEAMSLSNHLDDEISSFEKKKRILDILHSIDSSLVDKAIDLNDADEAKSTKKKYLEHIKLKDERKDIAANPAGFDLNEITPNNLADICFDNHAALSGGRIYAKPVEDFKKLSDTAAHLSMSIAFPMWGWIIENASRKSGARSKGERLLQDTYEAACKAAELTLALIGKSRQDVSTINFASDGLIRPGERDEIFERIRKWASSQTGQTIRISDPYFGPDDMDVVHCIAEALPNVSIRVLTCKKHLKKVVDNGIFDEAFQAAWKNLCELPPPPTEIVVIAWGPEGAHPVHDRWIFTEDSGLRLGTSTNSMGYNRISEISTMNSLACIEKCEIIDGLLDRKTKEWQGERISTNSFDI